MSVTGGNQNGISNLVLISKMSGKMRKGNLFNGDSYMAIFARAIYKRLISREWVTYADIMGDYLGRKCDNPSKEDHYRELVKASDEIKKLVTKTVGEGSIEIEGNNRNRRFRYNGIIDDPLSDLYNYGRVIRDLHTYWQFCQDSAGFFPASWLEHFFKECKDLLEIKKKKENGEQVLSTSLDRKLTNIELLPFLYETILQKKVLQIGYKPYDKESQILTIHPHFLKEFNGRWYLFGYEEGCVSIFVRKIALDRISVKPKTCDGVIYQSAPKGFYDEYFKNLVGVTHDKEATAYSIRVRAHNNHMFKLTETKPIHQSQQTTIPFGKYEDGEYGEFTLCVELNNEFVGRILQMWAGLEIVGPDSARREFKKRVVQLAQIYGLHISEDTHFASEG